jgi:ankyrin repeat protein
MQDTIQHLGHIKSTAYASSFADQNRFNSDGERSLIAAIKKRKIALVKDCLEDFSDKDFFSIDEQGNNALQLSIILNCPDIFNLIKEQYKVLITNQNNKGNTVLLESIAQGNMYFFNEILALSTGSAQQKKLLLTRNHLGLNALSLSAAMGYIQMVGPLLKLHKQYLSDSDSYLLDALAFAKTAQLSKTDSKLEPIIPKTIDIPKIENVLKINKAKLGWFTEVQQARGGEDERDNKQLAFTPIIGYSQVIALLEKYLNPTEKNIENEVTRAPVRRKLF